MLISALSASFLVAFGLGIFWRSRGRQDVFLFSFSSVVKSFYLAWFVFLVSYFTPFGQALPVLSLLAGAAAAIVLMKRVETGGIVIPAVPGSRSGKPLLILCIAAALGMTFVAALAPIGNIFTAWDALASWNRWATELSANQYKPMNTAYPILMPALWSLIYEAQSTTDIWFFSRAVLSVVPLGVIALVAHIGLRQGIIPFIALFIPLFFGFIVKEPLFSGYMDQPSAMLAAGGLLAATLAIREPDADRRNDFLMLGVITAALAVMTKQHAIFAAFSICALVGVMTFRRQISLPRAAMLAALFLMPIASFLFIYLQEQETLWGNLATLNQVASNKVGDQPKISAAFTTLSAELSGWIWVLLGIGTLANLAFLRKPQAWFALLVAGLTIPGFLTYAECCSYSERNGIWILGHLSISSYIGISLVVEKLSERKLLPSWMRSEAYEETVRDEIRIAPQTVWAIAGFLGLGLILISNEWPMSRLMERQIAQQRERIEVRTQTILQRQPGVIDFATDLVTPVQLMKFHPDVTQTYRYCQPMRVSCFQGTPVGKTLFVTASWFENETSLATIERFVAEGRLTLIAQERGMMMYKVEKELSDP